MVLSPVGFIIETIDEVLRKPDENIINILLKLCFYFTENQFQIIICMHVADSRKIQLPICDYCSEQIIKHFLCKLFNFKNFYAAATATKYPSRKFAITEPV